MFSRRGIALLPLLLAVTAECGQERQARGVRPSLLILQPKGRAVSESLTAVGMKAYKANQYEASEKAARQALSAWHFNRKARFLLGMSLAAQKKHIDDALDILNDVASEYADAYLELSRIYMDRGDMDKAMKALDRFTRHSRLESSRAQIAR